MQHWYFGINVFFTIVSFGNVLEGWPIQIPFASATLVGYNLFFGIQNVHVLHMNNVWVLTQFFLITIIHLKLELCAVYFLLSHVQFCKMCIYEKIWSISIK
jgi:hypothetical protein